MATLTEDAQAPDDATRAAWLLAIDPRGLGGLCLRGPPQATRESCLASLRLAWPADAPWRRLPLHIADDALLGGLDLGLSLAAGKPVRQAGLLAEAARGGVVVAQAERMDAGLAARISEVLETGHPDAHCVVVALDEGQAPDEHPPSGLLERLALVVTPAPNHSRLSAGALDAAAPAGLAPPFDVAEARACLARIDFDAEAVDALCEAASMLGLRSMRAPWQAWRAACASAASAGREQVQQEDLELAARLVLAPRARSLPAPAPQPAAPEPEAAAPDPAAAGEPEEAPSSPQPTARPPGAEAAPPPPAPAGQPAPPEAPDPPEAASPLKEQVIEAARAAIPTDLLEQLSAQGFSLAARAGASGRSGAPARAAAHGRPLTPRRGRLRSGARLDLLATLRAALPWQRLRQQERATQGWAAAPGRLLLKSEDFHLRRYRSPCETTTVFAVDASGSQALHRLAEAKGAVELLLADCYVRRDRVALVAFRGEAAETLLAPTRSLVRARRSLAGLPGGGGTPLAAGIDAALAVAQSVQMREGGRPVLVFLTDAHANIARDGSPGRARAMADALAAARRLAASRWPCLLIDTSARPQAAAQALANAMGARYVALPQGRAEALYGAVQRLTV